MDRRNSTGFTRGVVFALTFAMNERKTVAEMMGEFIPLDRLLLGEPLTVGSWFAILGISGIPLVAGIVIERKRRQ